MFTKVETMNEHDMGVKNPRAPKALKDGTQLYVCSQELRTKSGTEERRITSEYLLKMELNLHLFLCRPNVARYWHVSRSLPALSCGEDGSLSCCAALTHAWSSIGYREQRALRDVLRHE